MSSPAADIEIRPMSAADIPRVIELAASVDHAPHYSRSTWSGFLNPEAVPPRIILVAAAPNGLLHGFAVASLLAPNAELESIAVAEANQRRGIGRQLLQSIIRELLQAHIREIWLEVRVSNAPAIALYHGFGFRQTGVRPRYYTGPVEDALLMSIRLP